MAGSAHEPGSVPFPRLSFRVPLDPARLLRVRERVRDYLRMHCASLDDIDDVVLCVEEACANAIQHSGSTEDVEIEMTFEGERLEVYASPTAAPASTSTASTRAGSRTSPPSADAGCT